MSKAPLERLLNLAHAKLPAMSDAELIEALRDESEFFSMRAVTGEDYKGRLGQLLDAAADRIERKPV